MVPVVYSPAYNISTFGLARKHPFDGNKYRRIRKWLIRQGLRQSGDFVAPPTVTRRELLAVHTAEFLASLRRREVLSRIFEVPLLARVPAWLIDWGVFRPMRRATGGTILACRLALERGLAINLGGGYHHASGSRAGGFCVYADVPLALALLRREGKIASALVVDTDAHQGDGTADALRSMAGFHLLDFYDESIFPWPKVAETMAVPLPARTAGSTYLDVLLERLPEALERTRPDLLVYNAGSDVLMSDPLASLLLNQAEMAERDLLVTTQARQRDVPVAMVLSGGYGHDSREAHARSIEGILARFDRQT
jgi:histone deacetylase 11